MHRQLRLHWFVACYVLLLTEIVRGRWPVTLEWIEFGCVHKLYPGESDCVPVLLTRTLEQGPGPGLGCQGPGQGQGLESEGQAPRQ